MLGVVLRRFGELRVEEVAEPRPGAGDVLIDVACVQPSVTECMLIAGDRVALHDRVAAALAGGPTRFGGHEFAGVVREVGAAVTTVRPGDRVTAVETITCERCPGCRSGRPCVAPELVGYTRPGAFAERLVVPARVVVPVPAGLSASATAAVQPLVGAVHAHEVAGFRPGERMLVLGAGVMGLLATQLARRDSPGLLAVAGRSPAKLALAARFGADLVLDATAEDVEKAVRDATDGVGVDVVIETAGGAPGAGLAGTDTLELAIRCVRRGGRIVVVSVLPDRAEVPLGTLRERAVTLLHPPSGGPAAFREALRLVADREVDVESLVTHRLTGIGALPEAVEITRRKGRYGAINPAQVDLTGGDLTWPS